MEDWVYNRPDYPKKRTPVRSIRYFCVDCVCGQTSLIQNCPDSGCALWPYRMGRNPSCKSANRADSPMVTSPEGE